MSESNLVDKISEAFSNAIKRTNIFEKFIELKLMCNGLIIFTTITGATLLAYQEYNRCGIESIENKSSCIEYDIFILKKKMEKIIETNEKLYEIIMQNNKLLNKCIENQLLYICKANNTEVEIFNNEINETKEEGETKEVNETKEEDETKEEADVKNIIQNSTSYEELLNDCYDNIPCNNSKKLTGLNKLFNWN